MSLDVLTKEELGALVEYNLEAIYNAASPFRKGTMLPSDWAGLRKKLMKSIERIDRIVALGKGVA